jgi:glycosyltransferase involved in cell wall biosynthesis
MANNQIMVSVYLVTFQHAEYIRQAIDSILMQKVKFDYEIVVSDDCSVDGTQQILIEYKQKYGDKIRLNLNKKNIGPLRNSNLILKNCRGKYIAFLEGDDFWCDENKLQMQIDFLESNQKYAACFHNSSVIGDDLKKCKLYRVTKGDINDYKQYFSAVPTIPTASLVIRNIFKDNNYYHYFNKPKYIGDRILNILVLKHGKIKYLDFTMCTYRHNTNGGTSFSSQSIFFRMKDCIEAVKVQRLIVDKETVSMVDDYIVRLQNNVIDLYLKEHLYRDLLKYYFIELTIKEQMRLVVHRLGVYMKN